MTGMRTSARAYRQTVYAKCRLRVKLPRNAGSYILRWVPNKTLSWKCPSYGSPHEHICWRNGTMY